MALHFRSLLGRQGLGVGKEPRKGGILKDLCRRWRHSRETVGPQSSLYGQLKSHSGAKIKKAKRHRHAHSHALRLRTGARVSGQGYQPYRVTHLGS